MATPQENAETVRELIQRVMNEGDIGFAEKTLSESYVERSPVHVANHLIGGLRRLSSAHRAFVAKHGLRDYGYEFPPGVGTNPNQITFPNYAFTSDAQREEAIRKWRARGNTPAE